jgi:hypothetical protein
MKCLVLFGDGLCEINTQDTPTSLEVADKPHIENLTQLGCTGKLHVRRVNETDTNEQATISEILQLFDLLDEQQESPSQSILATRYHDMKVSIYSTEQSVVDKLKQYEPQTFLINNRDELNSKRLETALLVDGNDLVFVHIKSHNKSDNKNLIEYIDSLLIDNDEILSVVIMSYGRVVLNDSSDTTTNNTNGLRRPPQSYEIKACNRIENVRHNYPMYAVYYQNGSIRKDHNQLFTEKSCESFAGNGSILADHFFGEIAYKMCFSDKYGA